MENEVGFLLFMAPANGCVACEWNYAPAEAESFLKIEDLMKRLEALLGSRRVDDAVPLMLYSYDLLDGEIINNLNLDINSGCRAGIKSIKFTFLDKEIWIFKEKKNE